MKEFEEHIEQIKSICDKHAVKKLYVFGSIASGGTNRESDIDLLVEFGKINSPDYFDNYLSFKESLQQLFSRKIDLIEQQTLKNPVLMQSINENKELIYEQSDSKVVV